MAGLSDLMQYTPTGSAVTEGMTTGANINQSLASAQHARALAEESSAMLPYKLSEQAYEQDIRSRLDPNVMAQGKMGLANQQQALGQKAMFEFQQMPQEQQIKIKKDIEDGTNTFFNHFATLLVEFGDRDAAAQAMIAYDPSYAGVIDNLRKDQNLWNRFTPENAQKRLEANSPPKAPGSINETELRMMAAQGDPAAIAALTRMEKTTPPPSPNVASILWNASGGDVNKFTTMWSQAHTPQVPPSRTGVEKRFVKNQDGTYSEVTITEKGPGTEQPQISGAAIGIAPKGTPDGPRTLDDGKGTKVIVKDGKIYQAK